MFSRRAVSFTLTAVLWASSAHTQTRSVSYSNPSLGFGLTLPAGFVSVPFTRSNGDRPGQYTDANAHLAAFRRGGVIVELVSLGASLPQRALTERERNALRVADPVVFTDRIERSLWHGYSLETLHGEGPSMVRWATAVPLVDGALLVAVFAPSTDAPGAQRVHAAVLSSLIGRTDWQTPRQRVFFYGTKLSGAVALALMVLYAGLSFVLRRRGGVAPRSLGALAGVTALLWVIVTIGLLTVWPEAMVCAAMQSSLLAVVMTIAAVRSLLRERGAAVKC